MMRDGPDSQSENALELSQSVYRENETISSLVGNKAATAPLPYENSWGTKARTHVPRDYTVNRLK
jgi:hypothetical protein